LYRGIIVAELQGYLAIRNISPTIPQGSGGVATVS
jgi:hypothetical protein